MNGRASIEKMTFNLTPRATLIQRFDGSVVLIGPNTKEKIEFKTGTTFREIKDKARRSGWVVGFEHLHGVDHPFPL
jgi:hypothetical protein